VITAAEALEISVEPTDVQCYMQNNGSVVIPASGGTEPYSYSLDGINYIENNNFEDLPQGNYTAYVKDHLRHYCFCGLFNYSNRMT
jgi:hypothetical protein